ncbi:MAG TPA: tRNA lysidine(34) synthetase TilS [Candidatus Eisenbacteria bacterium]|nr:tRNA lysidine(34) synthetase TilS [Candidatus Eisenbacteria bacterium]
MNRFKELLQETELFIRRQRLLKRGEGVLVGLSGGPDSTALLALLAAMRRKHSLKLVAAHVDHGIHKRASRRHRESAERACARFGVPLVTRSADVKAAAKRSGRSLEEAGRIERYAFFEQAAGRRGCQKIATAHTLDDQAETVLLHIVRGAGLRGLGGIPASRPLGKYAVIRPLLGCRKAALEAMLAEEGLRFSVDPSNADRSFSRNLIRHWLLPSLAKKFNPRIEESLASLRDVCAHAQDFLDREAGRAWKVCPKTRRGGSLSLDTASLGRFHPAVRRQVILLAISEKRGDLRKISHSHVASIDGILDSPEEDLEISLPDGLRVRKSGGRLVFR